MFIIVYDWCITVLYYTQWNFMYLKLPRLVITHSFLPLSVYSPHHYRSISWQSLWYSPQAPPVGSIYWSKTLWSHSVPIFIRLMVMSYVVSRIANAVCYIQVICTHNMQIENSCNYRECHITWRVAWMLRHINAYSTSPEGLSTWDCASTVCL